VRGFQLTDADLRRIAAQPGYRVNGSVSMPTAPARARASDRWELDRTRPRPKTDDERMNRLERRYRDEVLEVRKAAGEILGYAFEPFSIRLAPRTYYRPDWAVWIAEAAPLDIHETKGHWEDDARVKIKLAAQLCPWFRFYAVRRVEGEWESEEIPSR